MAYPYIPSAGILQQPFAQFRKSFPKKVDAETLKRLGIAPSNEGYVIQTMKFLGLIDKEGQQSESGITLFTTHDDEKFAAGLEPMIRSAYADLFELRGDDAWTLDRGALITFFRGTDKTSEIVGGRQANAFTTLASLAGKRKAASPRNGGNGERKASKAKAAKLPAAASSVPKDTEAKIDNRNISTTEKITTAGYGLTVRIEVNLPANGSAETYDAIFKSIRKNLIDE